MVDFVVDKSLDLLLHQVDQAAPGRSKASDGSVGDEDHQARESAHNPEDTEDSMDGNDPDNQVDARDFTHDPAHGADMHVMTEALRVSRDRRLYLVIFNGRQFSSYARDGYAPFTWRPYNGSNQHTKHAHVQVNDYYNDTLTPWKIGIDMGLSIEERAALLGGKLTKDNVLHFRLRLISNAQDPLVLETYPDWEKPKYGLLQIGDMIQEVLDKQSQPVPVVINVEALGNMITNRIGVLMREILNDTKLTSI